MTIMIIRARGGYERFRGNYHVPEMEANGMLVFTGTRLSGPESTSLELGDRTYVKYFYENLGRKTMKDRFQTFSLREKKKSD